MGIVILNFDCFFLNLSITNHFYSIFPTNHFSFQFLLLHLPLLFFYWYFHSHFSFLFPSRYILPFHYHYLFNAFLLFLVLFLSYYFNDLLCFSPYVFQYLQLFTILILFIIIFILNLYYY